MKGLTLRELLSHLRALERQHGGDDEIFVTDLYGARYQLIHVGQVTRERTDSTSYISIANE